MRFMIMSAALLGAALAAPPAAAQGEEPFCVQKQGAPELVCRYRTMDQCEEATKGDPTAVCVRNPSTPGN